MFSNNSTTSKLIVLFVLEKMEIPLTENIILDICSSRNDWLNYMECKEIIYELLQTNLIYRTDGKENEQRYNITYEGQSCLSHFYQRIPLSVRENITEYIKENRIQFKRSQEYIGDYSKDNDGSYSVNLKIMATHINQPLFELNIKAPTRQSAIEACHTWAEKAHLVYEYIYETLIESE